MWEFYAREKVAETVLNATAYPVRAPHYYVALTARYVKRKCCEQGTNSLLVYDRHANPEADGVAREWVAKTTKYIRETNTERTGTKLATSTNFSLGPTYDSVEEVFGENLGRLKKIKAKYDPSKIWSKGWIIEPES